jgi:ABC-type glucose/galactose transport system permease subunit
MLKRIYHLDHLYGFLLTFGLALMIEGLFQWRWGSSGAPYQSPIPGGYNLGFMFLPTYRGFVVVAALVICLTTWYAIERTKLGAYLRAATENPTLVQAFGINVPRLITLTYGLGVGLRAWRACWRADPAGLGADGHQHRAGRVRRGGDRRHGLDHGLDRHRLRPRAWSRASPRSAIRRPPTP